MFGFSFEAIPSFSDNSYSTNTVFSVETDATSFIYRVLLFYLLIHPFLCYESWQRKAVSTCTSNLTVLTELRGYYLLADNLVK